MFYNSLTVGDVTRGCAIYVQNNIQAQEVSLESEHKDNIWIEIKLQRGDKLLVGCIYRSPNMPKEDNKQICNLLTTATRLNYYHLLIMGDFNYPKIDWASWSTQTADDEINSQFIETCSDLYIHQHVKKITRIRGTSEPSILDLVITNEEGMVSEIEYQSPISKSDHTCLLFNFNCYNILEYNTHPKFNFSRGDYATMNTELDQIDWDKELHKSKSIDDQWQVFTKHVLNSMDRCIPKKRTNNSKKYLTPLDNNQLR